MNSKVMILRFVRGAVFTFLTLLCAFPAAAQSSGIVPGGAQDFMPGQGGVTLNIRYYNKRIFYLDDEPIQVQVTVFNNSPSLYHFRLADNRMFSIDLDTRTMSNRALEAADRLERSRSTAGKVFFREVVIESGESFSFVENLRDYAKIADAGNYIIQAKLYPELRGTAGAQNVAFDPAGFMSSALVSNRLPLHIKAPSVLGEDGIPVALDRASGAVLSRSKIPPDEVIDWTLNARQKSQWEKYFLYLDLEKMIRRDGTRQRKWRMESEEGRQRMLADYRTELQKSTIDGDVTSIPSSYIIENTTYDNETGTVVVLERFKQDDYTEIKRYTYYLEKDDGYWSIVDYVVTNLGTE